MKTPTFERIELLFGKRRHAGREDGRVTACREQIVYKRIAVWTENETELRIRVSAPLCRQIHHQQAVLVLTILAVVIWLPQSGPGTPTRNERLWIRNRRRAIRIPSRCFETEVIRSWRRGTVTL